VSSREAWERDALERLLYMGLLSALFGSGWMTRASGDGTIDFWKFVLISIEAFVPKNPFLDAYTSHRARSIPEETS
jgi:hypothetical protein